MTEARSVSVLFPQYMTVQPHVRNRPEVQVLVRHKLAAHS